MSRVRQLLVAGSRLMMDLEIALMQDWVSRHETRNDCLKESAGCWKWQDSLMEHVARASWGIVERFVEIM